MSYPAAWLQGTSRGEAVACALRLQIIQGAIRPGDVLSENRLAADFETSRSPVREALKTLSGEGLVRLERMGAVVAGLSAEEVEELYDVRFLIESFAQHRLAQGDTEALFGELTRTIDKMELAVRHRDAVEFAGLDFGFHEAIITAAQHKRILHLWNSIRQIVLTVMLLTTDEIFSEGTDKLEAVIEKHRALIRGLESKDPERILAGVRDYFADSKKTLHLSLP
ncbi:GntR family transcriptional regulator [Paenibacillus sp. CC-CFT747]|nr:GntR family transcriptional regulator [Paenibacillus sp. CC-CFT747]